MNIIEAIKSGKPFRRKAWLFHGIVDDTFWLTDLRTKEFKVLIIDIPEDDWEVDETFKVINFPKPSVTQPNSP